MSDSTDTTDVVFSISDRLAVLVKARGLLLEHGVGKNRYYDPETGCFCAAGAVEEAVIPGLYSDYESRNGTEAYTSSFDEAWRLTDIVLDGDLKATLRERGYYNNISVFNDSFAEADVLTVFDQTIARLQREVTQ